MKRFCRSARSAAYACLLSSLILTTGPQQSLAQDLFAMSLQELMSLDVTSAGKKPQNLFDAATAIMVLSQEDIRRSGAQSLPEILRLVPGVQVARINSSKWAVTTRGFNGTYANKLLVLVDGRTIFSPTFSGVNWDEQIMLLEDIERIEVIRGPGATLWGANAQNGVINIITKEAAATQGWLASLGAGSEERAMGQLRYGGQMGEGLSYRLYGKGFERDESQTAQGDPAGDDWDGGKVGFRIDREPTDDQQWTVQGELYQSNPTSVNDLPVSTGDFLLTREDHAELNGGHLLGRYQFFPSAGQEIMLQAYYDVAERDEDILHETRQTTDLEFQHRFLMGQRHELIWGLGLRSIRDDFDNSDFYGFSPEHRQDEQYSAFVQDEMTLHPAAWRLVLGSKFEYNDYTHFEIQPNVRLIWTPRQHLSLWGSVSRSVRTPSRAENDMRAQAAYFSVPPFAPGMDPQLAAVVMMGSEDLDAETLIAYEVGLRQQLTARLFLDAALFYNRYRDIIAGNKLDPVFPSLPGQPITIPIVFDNALKGYSYGGELLLRFEATPDWTLQAGYSYLELELDSKTGGAQEGCRMTAGNSPRHQLQLLSRLNLPGQWEFDTTVYVVDHLPAEEMSGYLRLDARLGWHPTPQLEFSLTGCNLLDPQHPEFDDVSGFVQSTETERSLYAQVNWRY